MSDRLADIKAALGDYESAYTKDLRWLIAEVERLERDLAVLRGEQHLQYLRDHQRELQALKPKAPWPTQDET